MNKPSPSPSFNRIFSLSVPVCMALIVVLGFLAYANAVRHPFVHDDVVFILQNPFIARWDNIGDSFLNPSIPQSFQGLVTPYYRPVLEVFYRLQYAWFGFDPHGFHAFNVILHVLCGLLLFVLLRKMLKSGETAWLTAVLFVVHPVQTQAVACIVGISNVLCALLVLMSLLFYVYSSESTDHRRKWLWFVASLIVFVVALFTKEQAVFAAGLFFIYEAFLNSHQEKPVVRLYRLAVLGVAVMGYLFCRQILFGPVASVIFENTAELKLRLLAIPRTMEMFVGLLLFPVGLHYYRSIDILAPYALPLAVFVLLAVLTLLIIARLPQQERRKACFGLAWFLILLLPVLNIVPLVNEYSFVAASEHGLYLPMAGFFIFFLTAVFNGFRTVIERNPAKVRFAVLVIILVLCSMTIRQNTYWRGEIPLFERALTFEPQLGRVHVLLAKAYMFNGRMDEAIDEFNRAAVIMAGYAAKAVTPKARQFYLGFLKGIYADSAQCYLAKRDLLRAFERYTRALAIDPGDSLIYTNRALVHLQTGRIADGIRDLETALRLDPGNLLAANNLSICYIQQGELDRARGMLQGILIRDPSFAPARDNLRKLEQDGR